MAAVVTVLLLWIGFGIVEQSPSNTQAAQSETLIIVGAKNPELFPQWFVWEAFFQSLSETTSDSILKRRLGVSDSEFAFLTAEANRFRRAEEALRADLRAVRAKLTADGKRENEIRDVTEDLNLGYRERVLDGRSRVYATLTPETLARVLAWIDQMLSGTTVRLSGRTLNYFHKPW